MDARLLRLLEKPENKICADCHCRPSEWASLTYGVFVCISCSGVHRSLGTHISFIRSCLLDTWTSDQIRIMERNGNKKANSYFEANLHDSTQIPDPSNMAALSQYIKDKYVEKKWIPIEVEKKHHKKQIPKKAASQEFIQIDENDPFEEFYTVKKKPVQPPQRNLRLSNRLLAKAQSLRSREINHC